MFRQRIRLLITLILVSMVLLASGYYYFAIYTKTPEYALAEIKSSFTDNNLSKFHKYVALDKLLDNTFPAFVEGIMQTDLGVNDDSELAFNELAKLFKPTFVAELTEAIEYRIASGEWHNVSEDAEPTYSSQLIERLGLKEVELRSYSVNEADTIEEVAATINVYQSEIGEEMPLNIKLYNQSESNIWQVAEINNFSYYLDRLNIVRKERLRKYIEITDDINNRHNLTIESAELKLRSILVAGSLGKSSTREELKHIVETAVQPSWEERKKELMNINPPTEVKTLHALRLRICDLHIEYSKGYAEWMLDKNAKTIKKADDNLRQAMILEQEEKALLSRLSHLRNSGN